MLLAAQPGAYAQTDAALASKYAPVLRFSAGEKFYPTSVDYLITSSVVKLRGDQGLTSTVVDTQPKPETLGTHADSNMFLDNKLETLDSIAADYLGKADSLGYHAYVHIVRSGSSTVIQYWLFYIYNNGPLNEHQGDIEVVEVFLNAAGNPQQVLMSQHGSGENAAWGDVEKTDYHPIVYVALGSHANYFRSYQGNLGIESDVVGGNGKTIEPASLDLVMLGEQGDHPASQSWLDFPGRWGYWGTDQEMALGNAGPYGPVFNQDGIRWAQPQNYLSQTISVNGTYFILGWLVANFLLLFLIYIIARGVWKGWGIFKQIRHGGLLVIKFLKGPGGIGLMVGIAAIVLTAVALFLPWYSVSATSEIGQLSKEGGTTLMTLDGIHGLTVNMFMATTSSDSTSGYMNLFSAQLPFAIILGASVILLALDVIGIKNPKSLAKKFLIGIIFTLLPILLILLFISQLPAFLPFAYGMFPGQAIPTQVEMVIRAIGGSPVFGTAIAEFPIIGLTNVSWGLGIGAYLFIVAALLRLIGGLIMYRSPELQTTPPPPSTQPVPTAPSPQAPPPPPQPSTSK